MKKSPAEKVREMITNGAFKQAQDTLEKLTKKSQPEFGESIRTGSRFLTESALISKDTEPLQDGNTKEIPDITEAEIQKWTHENVLESKVIDGERCYFNRSVVNLFRMSPEAQKRRNAFKDQKAAGDPGEAGKAFDMNGHMRKVLDIAKAQERGV